MKKNENEKREIVVAAIVCVLILIIVGGMLIMKNMNNKPNKDENKEVDVEISYDGYELNEDEIEQEAEREFEEDYSQAGVFLGMLGYNKAGKLLLYTNEEGKMDNSLIIYLSPEDCEERFKESNETINVGGKDFKLYETGIDYAEYKNELLKYMSEEMFNKYFKPYTKEINSKLYITNEMEEETNIESFESIDDEKYLVSYQINGEIKENTIKIDKDSRLVKDFDL